MIPRASTFSSVVLPDSPSANKMKCGSASKSSMDRRELVLVEPDRDRPRAVGRGQVGVRHRRGQHAHPRRRRAVPRRAHLLDQIGVGDGEIARLGRAVDARQRGEEVQPLLGEAAAGTRAGHRGRDPPVDLGLGRIAEAQLDAGAERVLQRGADLGPAVGADDHVHAEGQALAGDAR